jgi:hypothetical protein
MSPDDKAREEMTEDMLLASLRTAALVREPVPAGVLAAAHAAFSWRLIDAELAELVEDSALGFALAGTRGGRDSRLVTFEVPGGTALELEATRVGAAIRLVGQVVPGRPGTAVVQHPGGNVVVEVDEIGRFAAHGIVPGAMRVKLRLVTPGTTGEPDLEIVTASLTL